MTHHPCSSKEEAAADFEATLVELLPEIGHSIDRLLRGREVRGWTCDDLLQETLLRALEAQRRTDATRVEDVRSWLMTIARNGLRSRLRRRAEESGLPADSLEEAASVVREEPPETSAAQRELQVDLGAALEGLGTSDRGAVLLRGRLQKSWEAVAAILDRPTPGAIRALHSRARTRLNESFGPAERAQERV